MCIRDSIQGVSRLSQGKLEMQAVIDMAGAVPEEDVKHLLDTMRSDRYEAMEACINELTCAGYSAHAIFGQLLEAVVADSDITDMHKAKASIKLAEVEKNLVDGGSEKLQLLHACSYIQCVMADKAPLPGTVA